jgi:hypothetical protein
MTCAKKLAQALCCGSILGTMPNESEWVLRVAEKLLHGAKPQGFVTGHDFSRAEDAAKMSVGFSPCKTSPCTKAIFSPFPQPL